MHDILQCMTVFCSLPQHNVVPVQVDVDKNLVPDVRDNCGTQTEIIAVHTPQVDNPPFPFNNKLQRPSTLPLDSAETSSLPSNEQLTTSDDRESCGGDYMEKPLAATPVPGDTILSPETFSKVDMEKSPDRHHNENHKDLIVNKED